MVQKDEDLFTRGDMSEKSCLDCCNYIFDGGHGGCKLHDYYIPTKELQKMYAKDCADYTLKTTEQSCVNCVHYRDKRCFLHNFDIKDPKYSASLCAEFTPINTQKSCESCKYFKKWDDEEFPYCEHINMRLYTLTACSYFEEEDMNKFEKNLEMIADDLYKLDNQQVTSENLTLISPLKSCEECIYYEFRDGYLNCKRHSCVIDDPLVFAKGCIDYAKKIKQQDPVNPSHYTQGKIECIDAIEAALTPEEFRGFLKGNVFKYMWRHENKNGLQDVKKGEWYYQRLLKVLEDKEG